MRALIVGSESFTAGIAETVEASALINWSTWVVDSIEQAHFFLQQQAADLVVVDESIVRMGSLDLTPLTMNPTVPLLYLASTTSDNISTALRQGADQWLPRELILTQPEILEAALETALARALRAAQAEETGREMDDCRQQISRLTNLLWQVTPNGGEPRWHSQRYMLERLEEEVLRTERYGHPLSLILGEVHLPGSTSVSLSDFSSSPIELTAWTAERVTILKRRSDVAGQYGPLGFMMLLPNTRVDGAEDCCRRIRAKIEKDLYQPTPATTISVQSCFGVSHTEQANSPGKQLLRQAEEQLADARESIVVL